MQSYAFIWKSQRKMRLFFCQSKIVYHICPTQRPSCSQKSARMESYESKTRLKNWCFHRIIVLARRMYKMLPAEMQSAINCNEALIISLSHLPRNSKQSALARNKFIISIADNVVFGALDPTSSLTNLVEEQKLLGIEIHASV